MRDRKCDVDPHSIRDRNHVTRVDSLAWGARWQHFKRENPHLFFFRIRYLFSYIILSSLRRGERYRSSRCIYSPENLPPYRIIGGFIPSADAGSWNGAVPGAFHGEEDRIEMAVAFLQDRDFPDQEDPGDHRTLRCGVA